MGNKEWLSRKGREHRAHLVFGGNVVWIVLVMQLLKEANDTYSVGL